MLFDFLTPRIDRLAADGTVRTVHSGSGLGRLLRRPVVLIARDLCSFSLFQTSNLPRNRRLSAAQLHARSAAPYSVAGWKLIKTKDDFGIWWWDADRVGAWLAAANLPGLAPVLCPETLMQPAHMQREDTWRIVRLAQGYEAQLLRDKSLHASAWRANRFDQAAWLSFVRLQRGSQTAPMQVPPPSDLPVVYNPAQATAPIELTRNQWLMLGGTALVTASLCLSAYLVGGTLQLKKDTQEVLAETAKIRLSSPAVTSAKGLDEAQKMLVAYSSLEAQTNPLTAAGAAIGILAYHDLTPISINAETDKLNMVIGYGAMNRIETLIEDLQNSGYFHEIEPKADSTTMTITITMAVRDSAPPLTPGN